MIRSILTLSAFLGIAGISPAHAATGLDGAAMGWPWALPFAAMVLSIAIGPLLYPNLWHRHYGKVALGWSVLALAMLAASYGITSAAAALVHAMLAEYLSFIALLFALYVVAGGIVITGNLRGTPIVNTALLAIGTLIASLVGTTGAAMILIRPLLTANETRAHKAHIVVFFILVVANIGGALSPLGDPPLFVGFLRGVEFFWPAQHLWQQTVIIATPVLALFFAVDWWLRRQEAPAAAPSEPTQIAIHGRHQPRADRAHRRRHPRIGHLETGRNIQHLRHASRPREFDARCGPHSYRAGFALAHPGRASRGQRLHLGADPRGRQAVRRHLRHDHSCAGDARCRPQRRLRMAATHRDGGGWIAARGRVFLADRRAIGLPRQRAHLSGVLRARGRRCACADGSALRHARGDLDGRGLHGCADLHRQRAEFHGVCNRAGTRD